METNFVHRPHCELCGSESKKILVSVDFSNSLVWDFLESYYQGRIDVSVVENVSYEIVECQNCGFVWQGYVLNEEKMGDLYSVWISAEHSLNKKRYADIGWFDKYAREGRTIFDLVKKQPHQTRVLDFGMGWGYWCRMAQAFGYKVKGFEVSPPRVAYARQMGIDVIDSYSDISKHKFDFINSEQVFEHVLNPTQTLMELSSSLEIGGVIRIAVPDGDKTLKNLSNSDWKAAKDALHPLEHINCFTHDSLREMGKRANLEYLFVPQPVITTGRKEAILNAISKFTRRPRNKTYQGTELYFQKIHN